MINRLPYLTMSDTVQQNPDRNSLRMPPLTKEEILIELKHERKERIVKIILIIVACISALIVGEAIFYLLYNNVVNPKGKDANTQQGANQTSEDTKGSIQFEPIDKVAYISNKNIWLYNPDRNTDKNIQITGDGGKDVLYEALAWRNKEELSFSKCMNSKCMILTYNTTEQAINSSFDVQASRISAIRWSHKGDLIAYLQEGSDTTQLVTRQDQASKSIYEFSEQKNKAADFDDARYIRFSPDDSKIMLVDTYIADNKAPIVVLDMSGSELLKLEKGQNKIITNGFFMSSDTIYYKKDDLLYIRSVAEDNETTVTDRIRGGFNAVPSLDRVNLFYWTYNYQAGIATVWMYDMTTGTVRRLKDQQSYPVAFSATTIITLATEDCLQCPMQKFKFKGINLMDLESRDVTSLVEADNFEAICADNI